jgi:hydrogenase maturation protein HypF
MSAERTARDFRIRGLVQGVGFRPTVYRIAVALGLAGSVYNDAEGVVVHLEGDPRAVDAFPETLLKEKPPLARIDSIEPHEAADAGETAFRIDATPQGGHVRTAITADASVCEACLKEVFDPQDRRWRYAFANCTHCGPRFTITRHLPYDRPQTSMAAFPMCADCRAEYENPLDRRFHAQPIACPVCGPSLTLTDAEGNPLPGDPVRETVKAVLAGKIVAMKGLGGFHLVCDARNAEAVAALRERKHRDEKPLAVMVAGLRSARLFADVTEKEEPCASDCAPEAPAAFGGRPAA